MDKSVTKDFQDMIYSCHKSPILIIVLVSSWKPIITSKRFAKVALYIRNNTSFLRHDVLESLGTTQSLKVLEHDSFALENLDFNYRIIF